MYICIDLGGTNVRAALVDDSPALIGAPILRTRPKSLDGVKAVLAELLHVLSEQAPAPPRAVGLATAGPLDIERGAYLTPSNMPELHNWAVGPWIAEHQGLPALLENDAQAAAYGEVAAGGLKGSLDAVVLTLGTGVGSGVIVNGEIQRAGHVTGPELGHMYLGPGRKIRCGCGQVGCAETWLNRNALADLLRQKGVPVDSLRDVDAHLAQKNPQALAALDAYGRRLGIFIADLAVVFGPRPFGIAGGVSRLAPHFLPATRATIAHRLANRPYWRPVTITPSPDPDRAALLGMAALLARRGA